MDISRIQEWINSPEVFFTWFKEATEAKWAEITEYKPIYGFQIQPGTVWRNGLSDEEIEQFEKELGFQLPPAVRAYYKTMNGLSKQQINVFGDPQKDPAECSYSSSLYSYPEDINNIKEQIAWIVEDNEVKDEDFIPKGELSRIFPISGHRFVMVDASENGEYPVLSMYGDDIIGWAANVQWSFVKDYMMEEVADDAGDLPEPEIARAKGWNY